MKAQDIERIVTATVKAYFESEAYRDAQMQMITEIIREMNEG
ncbi:MAG: hypothetical protein WC096_08420 [Sphaerochaetaceae bacterium]